MASDVSPMLIEQRIRNRIYEHLEAVAGYRSDGGGWGLNDVVNDWDMWVQEPFTRAAFSAPAFSPPEVEAIADVHAALEEFAHVTPPNISDERVAMSSPEWCALVKVCQKAVVIFATRGKLPEDEVVGHEV